MLVCRFSVRLHGKELLAPGAWLLLLDSSSLTVLQEHQHRFELGILDLILYELDCLLAVISQAALRLFVAIERL